MRVGINALFWGQETTGSGQYTRCLVRELMALKTEYTLFLPREAKLDTEETPPHRFIDTPFPKNGGLAKLWFEQISFPRACQGMDVAHVPYFAPPLFPSRPTVVTIHDLIPLILPAYKGSILVRFYTRLVSLAAKRAQAIITDSHSSKRDIINLLKIPGERVHVIPLAADERFKPGVKTELDRVRRKYNLPQEFILYLGGFDQRKNMNILFKGFKGVKERLGDRCPLVIAGTLPSKDTSFFPHPRRLAEEAGVSDAVRFIGWVPEEKKPALYGLATLFLYPSLYEGFGLPPLEAMACGTPVIASNAASLPEVVGDGGVLVDPREPEAWAEAMVALLTNPQKREEFSAKAVEQARKFSWQRTARETLEVYKQVAVKR
ncbi:MAG: glycosyltransferase family 4 protein [Anaerolineae bacterium]